MVAAISSFVPDDLSKLLEALVDIWLLLWMGGRTQTNLLLQRVQRWWASIAATLMFLFLDYRVFSGLSTEYMHIVSHVEVFSQQVVAASRVSGRRESLGVTSDSQFKWFWLKIDLAWSAQQELWPHELIQSQPLTLNILTCSGCSRNELMPQYSWSSLRLVDLFSQKVTKAK